MKTIVTSGRGLILAATAAAVVMTGCANMTETQRNTAIGAGVGAAAGGLKVPGRGATWGGLRAPSAPPRRWRESR